MNMPERKLRKERKTKEEEELEGKSSQEKKTIYVSLPKALLASADGREKN